MRKVGFCQPPISCLIGDFGDPGIKVIKILCVRPALVNEVFQELKVVIHRSFAQYIG